MTHLKRMALAVAVPAAAISMAMPGVASAKAGDQTYQKTFPVASLMCANVAAGTEGPRVRKVAVQVAAACTVLQSEFTTTQTTVLAARTALDAQIAAARLLTTTACPVPNHQPVACAPTRVKDNAVIKSLKLQERQAAKTYFTGIEAVRAHFWHAVRSLPGLHRARTDAPVDVKKALKNGV